MVRSLIAAALLAAAALSGCSSLDSTNDETVGWSAQRIYGEAKDAQAGRVWQKAIKLLEKLEARYPYGRYAQQAQLEVAYCQYKDQERASAIAAADRGSDGHPDAGLRSARPHRPARLDPARTADEFPEQSVHEARRREEIDSVVAPLGSRLVKKALIIGAAGMIGRKLTDRLAKDGGLDELLLHDVVAPTAPAAPFKIRSVVSDLSTPGEAEKLLAGKPELIFR